MVLGLNTPAFVDALDLLGKWYAEGLIDPEFITDLARSSQLDIAGKFAEGRIGYPDHLNYDDIQWDNDGQLNAKWMANQPAWYDWFMANTDNPELIYSTTNVTDFSEEMKARGPYYITMPPVVGPYGQAATRKSPQISGYLAFGKQVLEEEGKL